MLGLSSYSLEFQDIIELNTNYHELHKQSYADKTHFYFIWINCYYCNEPFNYCFELIQKNDRYIPYIKPYFVMHYFKYDVISNGSYKKSSIIDTLDSVKHYLMHEECLEKYKVIPK